MKSKSKTNHLAATPTDYSQPWITDTAWITGLTGAFAILVIGFLFGLSRLHVTGLEFIQASAQEEKNALILLALGAVSILMIAVELVRLALFKGFEFICKDPLLAQGKIGAFIVDAVKRYLALLLLFFVCRWLYFSCNEYGYIAKSSYYQPWFYVLDVLWSLFIVGGLPYVLLTRAFKYNAQADQKDLSQLTIRVLIVLGSFIPALKIPRPQFTLDDRRAATGLAVKFFFAPVMTVFFYDNFTHLLNNSDYLASNALPKLFNGEYDHAKLATDLGNILTNIIFTLDVGLAWCGYVISSRWLDNNTVSAEPTVLGWVVCLISYPPFRVVGGWLLTGPGESLYTQIPNQPAVAFFGSLMMATYFLYMLPTIWFGLRFSNLTHRGIIRTGPYAFVRHPAYAAKNLAWWCVGFPTAIYAGFSEGINQMIIYLAGLVLLTSIYYARAITEERHLRFDPNYVEYCSRVKYRFFPGLI
ncbi:MAG: hypothetical protein U1F46_07240 [Marinagarivorans sp.]